MKSHPTPALQGAGDNPTNSNGSPSAPTSSPGYLNLPSLINTLFSYPGATDWLKMLVFGWFLEVIRRFSGLFYNYFIGFFCVKASFCQDDYSYHWISAWIAEKSLQMRMRDVDVSTQHQDIDNNPFQSNLNIGMKNTIKARYLPSPSGTFYTQFLGVTMGFTRSFDKTGLFGAKEHTFNICFYTRDTTILDKFITAAHKVYLAANEGAIITFTSDSHNLWQKSGWTAKTLGTCLVLPPGVAEKLVADLKDFLRSKAWYIQRGIPYRFGILLHGPPGSGKTSFIRYLAAVLDCDIYFVSLSKANLDDNSLAKLINSLPEKCLAVMEDIDAAFTHPMRNRDAAYREGPETISSGMGPLSAKVTLSGLLNALDGVCTQEGRVLVTTTNKYWALDPALIRPGRMDIHVEFKNASRYQAQELFIRFYVPPDMGSGSDVTVGSPVAQSASITSISVEKSSVDTPNSQEYDLAYIEDLANEFSKAIPEYEISMAGLQGYLMKYKTSPAKAVKDVRTWVDEELAYQRSRTNGGDISINPSLTLSNANVSSALPSVPSANGATAVF